MSGNKICQALVMVCVLVQCSGVMAQDSLLGWWMLDEGEGITVSDLSGNGHHGTIIFDDPNCGLGQDGSAWDIDPNLGNVLSFNGDDVKGAYVDAGFIVPELTPADDFTWAFWAKQEGNGSGVNAVVLGNRYGGTQDPIQFVKFTPTNFEYYYDGHNGTINYEDLPADEWVHHVSVKQGENLTYYRNGEESGTNTTTATIDAQPFYMGGDAGATGITERWSGRLLDVRLYTRALSPSEIEDIMFDATTPPEISRAPKPKHQQKDVVRESLLRWRPGLYAVQHDLYLGTDFNDVNEASSDDPRGVLVKRGMIDTSFDPGLFDFAQTYYWRVDEVNDQDPNSPWKGNIWTFTVANHLLIDDFESYNNTDNKIYYAWLDFFTNNTGATVGYLERPFAERDIVYAGKQSMPLHYDNNGIVNEGTDDEIFGTLLYSEAECQWTEPQDWTRDGVESLTLWFRGHLPIVGSFTEEPAGMFQVTGIGSDIFKSYDEFHFAYKEVSGQANIIARVDNLDNTDPFAKAGIMIRDSLEPGAKYCAMLMTPENGVRFQYRTSQGAVTDRQFDPNVAVPYWVKLERPSGGLVRAYYSPDGSDWVRFNLIAFSMTNPNYIGLAVSSHNELVPCTATFSNVSFPDTNVDPTWTAQDVGIFSNEAQPLYVVVNDDHPVCHDDDNASVTVQWTQWQIPLQTFTDSGIDLQNVTSLGIGIGNRDNPQSGGQGRIYIDNIVLSRPPVE